MEVKLQGDPDILTDKELAQGSPGGRNRTDGCIKTIYDTPPPPTPVTLPVSLGEWRDQNGRYNHHIYQAPERGAHDIYSVLNEQPRPIITQPASLWDQGSRSQGCGNTTTRTYKAMEASCSKICFGSCCLAQYEVSGGR